MQRGWRFWLLVVLFASGAALSLGAALLFLLVGLAMLTPILNLPSASALSFLNIAFASGLMGVVFLLGLASLVRNAPAAPQKKTPGGYGLTLASLAMLVWLPLVVFFRAVETSSLAWLFLPSLVIIGAVIPAWWLIEIARRRLNVLQRGQEWQILSTSFALTIPLTLVLSLGLLAVYMVVLGAYLNTQPQLLAELQRFFERFDPSAFDLQQLERLTEQVFSNPVIVTLLVSLVAGLTPLVEELLKPLPLFFFAGDRPTPAQGFVGGALCGAAFGLWENLSALAGAGNGSGSLILVVRIGSLLLHITATAMLGWGLASFWGQRRFVGRLIGTYLLAVGLHASWNLFGVLSAVPVTPQTPLLNNLPLFDGTMNPLWLALPVLVIFNMGLLLWMNSRLQREAGQGVAAADQPADGQFTVLSPQTEQDIPAAADHETLKRNTGNGMD
ncbi:MAG: hypothetical protein AB1522_14925 [Chloroflexota bacterium]